jgi:hypothetical protein
MRSFYSNLAQEDTKNTKYKIQKKKKKKKKMRVKNAIVLKKIPKTSKKGPKSPILKKRL